MDILAFSDLHGHAPTLKLLRDKVRDESYDYILVAGDLTNADLIQPTKRLQQVKEIFSIMESFRTPYYYVWGKPFREGSLASAMRLIEKTEDYKVIEQERNLVFQRKIGNLTKKITMTKDGWKLCKEIGHFLSSLNFGNHLKEGEPIRLGKYWLTSSPRKLPQNAILLKHHYRKLISKALIHLDGHTHAGQHVLNYLNLGFLYRDAAHKASPMIGCYWKLNLEGPHVSVKFANLGGKLKELKCPNHPGEGTFYIPFYWKKCPLCFDPRDAIVKENKS